MPSADLPSADRAVAGFVTVLGGRPDGVWVAPGRVNLIGEHVDYAGGLVLPFAIDTVAAVAVRARDDALLRVAALDLPGTPVVEVALADVAPGVPGGWAAYVAGTAAVVASAGAGAAPTGLDIALASDVPVGAGLSSSAAVECAIGLAAQDLWGSSHDPMTLALLAQRAENEIVGAPCGPMDQVASTCGRSGHAVLLDCRDLTVEPVPLDVAAAGCALLVVDSRVTHDVGAGPYGQRRASVERAAAALGLVSLRDATIPDVRSARDRGRLDRVDADRAEHVVAEVARVEEVVALLRDGSPAAVRAVGPVLTRSHGSLRDLMTTSCPELDAIVDAVLAAGALGARIVGGGFGGSAVVLCDGDPRSVAAVTTAARAAVPGAVVRAVAPADGARRAG